LHENKYARQCMNSHITIKALRITINLRLHIMQISTKFTMFLALRVYISMYRGCPFRGSNLGRCANSVALTTWPILTLQVLLLYAAHGKIALTKIVNCVQSINLKF
jgi:hypothetical protein